MPADWEDIRTDYEKAMHALRCPNGAGGWQRDEATGKYYMWKAFYEASATEPKDQLLYARILALMASETGWGTQEYDRFQQYVKPALDAYLQAEQAGQNPTAEEMERIKIAAASMTYEFERWELPFDQQIAPIIGHEKLNDFSFHDSKPVRFEQVGESACLSLRYSDVTATFLFEDVLDVHVEGDPKTNWISDFACYPCYHRREVLTFDVGYYKIVCKKISVECERTEEKKICSLK